MYWQEVAETWLRQLVDGQRFGFITDVDGTISHIAPVPDEATVTEYSRHALSILAEHLPLVGVISGRAAADIHERVGVESLVYVGNHGLERWVDGDVMPNPDALQYRSALKAAKATIEEVLWPGMFIEDKRVTLSVHYRQAEDPDAVMTDLTSVMYDIADQHGVRCFEGRRIFEFRPPIDKNKGSALIELIADFELDTAIYLGDDVTDVDAFLMARRLRDIGTCYALAAGVESADGDTPQAVRDEADFLVTGVSDVESLLSWFVDAVRAS
ncbi:MAG: trehalose-phosphatase [Chloroflexi bacterium]|nr:trehalose-phosphatase [Chloroflexota bacterium]